jgi:exonuclease V gamma subunit
VDKLWSEMDGIFWGIIYSTKDLYEIPIKKSKINSWSGERFLTGIINQMKISMAAV